MGDSKKGTCGAVICVLHYVDKSVYFMNFD